MDEPIESQSTHEIAAQEEEPKEKRSLFKTIAWLLLFLLLLVVFTLFKLPEDKIQGYVLSSISSILAEQGITFSATKSEFNFLLTPSFSIKEVVFRLPQGGPEIRIDKIKVIPSFLALFMGRQGAAFSIEMGESKIEGTASIKKQDFKTQATFRTVDLKKTGLLASLAKISGSGVIDGEFKLSGSSLLANTWNGTVQLQLSRVVIDPQSINGFEIPKISISESRADFTIDQGKARIQTFRIGKTGNTSDDIHANLTGEVTLANRIDASTLKLRAKFDISKSILEFPKLALFGALLSPAKQSDGSYMYDLTGPLYAVTPMPATP